MYVHVRTLPAKKPNGWYLTWSLGQSSSPVERSTPVTMSWSYQVKSDHICLFIFGHVWSNMVISVQNWSYVIITGHIWLYLIISGKIWSYLLKSGQIWSYLIISGQLWSYLIICIWSNLTISDHIWSYFTFLLLLIISYATMQCHSEYDWSTADWKQGAQAWSQFSTQISVIHREGLKSTLEYFACWSVNEASVSPLARYTPVTSCSPFSIVSFLACDNLWGNIDPQPRTLIERCLVGCEVKEGKS